jgi:(p)ppGpp synthase/HD superfamily hydrolase
MENNTKVETSLYAKAREFAIQAHNDTNCKYDGFDYSVHLLMVAQIGKEYKHLLSSAAIQETAMCACWLHDVIEDCRITYNDLKKEFNEDIAECVFMLTHDKGRNRKDRMSASYYFDIYNNEAAKFVKICDRIANATYSKETGSRMLEVYKKEHEFFTHCLCDIGDTLEPMINQLNDILKDND